MINFERDAGSGIEPTDEEIAYAYDGEDTFECRDCGESLWISEPHGVPVEWLTNRRHRCESPARVDRARSGPRKRRATPLKHERNKPDARRNTG